MNSYKITAFGVLLCSMNYVHVSPWGWCMSFLSLDLQLLAMCQLRVVEYKKSDFINNIQQATSVPHFRWCHGFGFHVVELYLLVLTYLFHGCFVPYHCDLSHLFLRQNSKCICNMFRSYYFYFLVCATFVFTVTIKKLPIANTWFLYQTQYLMRWFYHKFCYCHKLFYLFIMKILSG